MTRREAPPLGFLLGPEEPSEGGKRLTAEERRSIHAAAQAEGFSEEFAELLCRFAELIGSEQVLAELKQMKIDGLGQPV